MQRFKERDKRKAELAEKKGLTLIFVPFWWDWNVDRYMILIKLIILFYLFAKIIFFFFVSLIASIKQKRNDLFPEYNCSLPPFELTPPPEIISKFNYG